MDKNNLTNMENLMIIDVKNSLNEMSMLHTIYFGLKEYFENRLII
jgi:hypothetical protein